MSGDRPDRGDHSTDNQLVTLGELWHVEDRIGSRIGDVKAEVTTVRDEFEAYAVGHDKVHRDHDGDGARKYDEIMSRFHTWEVEAAKRAGALGVVRFLADLAGRNWKAIATLALTALAALGNIRIEVLAQ